jgi:hypothetical protein
VSAPADSPVNGRLFTATLLTALLAILIPSCLQPVGFPEDIQSKIQPPGPGAAAITIDGIAPKTAKNANYEIAPTATYMGKVEWEEGSASYADPNSPHTFAAFKDYTALISLAMIGGQPLPPAGTAVSVTGALSSTYDAATGTITATFPRTHRPVDNVAELNGAINQLAFLPTLKGANNKNIIELTPAFYTDANDPNSTNSGNFITIGAGAADNTIPYTIRGLGKYSAEQLEVGILLANNNITLEGVRFDITTSAKGIPHQWGTGSLYYRAAVIVGRYTMAPIVANPAQNNYAVDASSNILPSRNVTVQNCNISLAVSDSMIAGIYVNSYAKGNPLENISIADNEISVEATNNSGSAAQALLINRYAPTLSITGNGLKSKNAPSTHNRPAGGLYMQIDPDLPASITPLIGGNTINGSPTYDFYININSAGNRTGVQAMTANGFATPDSIWMASNSTDTGPAKSFHKKLMETLLPQTRSGLGYGYLAMYFGGIPADPKNTDCVFEVYHRESNRLYGIDFWGYTINKTPTMTYNTTPEVRARLLLAQDGTVYKNNAKFCWYVGDTSGTNLP